MVESNQGSQDTLCYAPVSIKQSSDLQEQSAAAAQFSRSLAIQMY